MIETDKVRTVGSVLLNYPCIAGIMWHLTVIKADDMNIYIS